METIDIAVIGGGPAGLTAALYASRARAKTVVFETALPGGQIVTTDWVENYPAFPEGVSGAELSDLMYRQAEHFGAEFRTFASIESIVPQDLDFIITNSEGEQVLAHAVILATGAVPKRLNVPGEAEFTGRGVSWCATCDGALFRGKTVAVVGGGDAAVEEALFLTKFAEKVYVIHRRNELRATKCIQERCFENEKVEMKWSRVVGGIKGEDGKVVGLDLIATNDEPDEFLPLDGVFIFVGVEPKSALVDSLCDLDDGGYVRIDPDGRTSYPGLYAAGDVTVGELKQVVTAAAGGAAAAFEAVRYIDDRLCSIG
ncbi:thioredoxin-disulfide reductase [Anaerosoma tenue]|uniref:thioredoxin-disulfide reductase n=1 Tax=Anaerosoma tenue TaxID=2933588 RepID=UPI00226083B2|nr:thioredoxin-disulfide reductase [Anaerosoma tenue]MCK8115866.1 thioredoxin-disulfide reductase [Anaerosoma tenue]